VTAVIRRAVAALALVGVVSGCTTFSDADAIARVNDEELSQEFLDSLLPLAGPGVEVGGGSTGTNAEAARNLISQWIQVVVAEEHLAEIGAPVTDEAIAAAEALVDSDPLINDPASEVDDDLRTFLIEAQAAFDTFNQLPDPQASFAEALEGVDIVVDARYGTYDPTFGVVPLGQTGAGPLG